MDLERSYMDHPLSDLQKVIGQARAAGAVKIHLLAGKRPCFRVEGILTPVEDEPVLHFSQTQALAEVLLNEEQRAMLEAEGEIVVERCEGGDKFEVAVFYGEGCHNVILTLEQGG